LVNLSDIRDAAEILRGVIVESPCAHSITLSQITGAEVFLKLENQQFTASFKERGALVKLVSLGEEERRRGVVAMSAGNHAQAVAFHAQRLGVPATIVMPRFTPNVKIERTRAFGAEVISFGDSLEESHAHAEQIARERGCPLIHPYDDEAVIAGQGTIALEMLDAEPDLEVLVVPVGGGGLIAGIAVAARAVRPELEIVGVQTELYPAMVQALKGEPIRCGTNSIAEGIEVKQPGRLTLPIVRDLVDEVLVVDEIRIEEAALLLLEVELTLVEGAGAAALAALLAHPERFRGRRVGLVVSGGNIDMLVLASIIQRGLVRSHRLVRLRVGIPDVPGALTEATALIGAAGANIVEVHHQRAFSQLAIKIAEVEFVVQTLGRDHATALLSALRSAGYGAEAPSLSDAGEAMGFR